MDAIIDLDLFAATLRIMTPIALAASGGLLSWRAGVFNIALDGFMLAGSFFAIVIADAVGNVWIGVLGGMISGVLLSFIFGIATQTYDADEIVAGIAINLLAFGMTTFLLRAIFGASGVYRPAELEPLPELKLAILERFPLLDATLNGQTPLVYAVFAFVILTYVLLYRTSMGLAIRSVGEHEEAALTAGISPWRVKMFTILWSGALSGLAGAHLSTGYVFEFSENMVQGRGFTAVTAVVFGALHPIWTFLASLVFGFADALGFRLQLEGFGVPPELMKTFPYLLAIVVLTLSAALRRQRLSTAG